MKNNFFRYYKPDIIIGFIILVGTIFGIMLTFIIKSVNSIADVSYYQYPSASVAVGLFVFLIDWKLWKVSPFKYLFLIPNLNGRYLGHIKYDDPENDNKETMKKCVLEIAQTGSSIKVNCYFHKEGEKEKTPSQSIFETITKNDDGSFTLVFTYRNHGLPGKFQEHSGTNILKYFENDEGRFLKGVYYTNRIPQTRGEMEVKFITNNLKHDF